jgi:chromate transport protein ChrA
METLKKNPILMGIFSAVCVALGILLVEFVLSLIHKTSLGEQLSDTVTIIILIAGTICSGVSAYLKAKKNLSEKQEK